MNNIDKIVDKHLKYMEDYYPWEEGDAPKITPPVKPKRSKTKATGSKVKKINRPAKNHPLIFKNRLLSNAAKRALYRS